MPDTPSPSSASKLQEHLLWRL